MISSMISYTVEKASAATCIGQDRIRDAIRRGDLVAHYVGVKAIILPSDLVEWIQALPTSRQDGKADSAHA